MTLANTTTPLYLSALEHLSASPEWNLAEKLKLRLMTDDELVSKIANVMLSARAQTLSDNEVDIFWSVRAEIHRRARARALLMDGGI